MLNKKFGVDSSKYMSKSAFSQFLELTLQENVYAQ